jgi:outer membrane receptor protein involved in Fe transport
VVSVQTKSGTNEFHGSAFEFLQRDNFQARNPFSQSQPDGLTGRFLPEAKRDQFGGSVGGPIVKNKWFFFADYQGLRSSVAGSQLLSVPTAAARNGDLSAYGVNIYDPESSADPASRTQFPGNVIPQGRLSPQAQAILALVPAPNAAGRDNGTRDNFLASGTEKFDSNAFNVRIDGRISSSLNVFARYSRGSFLLDGPQAYGPGGGAQLVSIGGLSDVKNQSLAAGFDYTLSPTSVLDVRFGFFQYKVDVLPNDFGTSPMADAGVPGLNLDDFSSGLSAMFIRGGGPDTVLGTSLDQIGGRLNAPLAQNEKQAQVVVNFTKLLGDHTLKVGLDIRRAYNFRLASDQHRSGELSFNAGRTAHGALGGGSGLASFLLGDVNQLRRFVGTTTDARERQWRQFYYAQDTWRASPKLTLNYGLRLSIVHPETVNEAGNGSFTNQDTGMMEVMGIGDVPLNGGVENALHWEPRLGLTYQLDEKTVIRAGYGRSHDVGVFGTTFGHAVTQNLPVLAQQNVQAPSDFDRVFNLSEGPVAPTFVQPGPDGRFPLPDGVQTFVRPSVMTLPRLDAWNVTVQRQLTETLSGEIGYVGNRGSQTFAEDNPDGDNNQPVIEGFPDVPRNDRRPFFAQFGWTDGWSLLAHYTLQRVRQSHNDYFFNDPMLGWGRAGWDRVSTLTLAATYELPIAKDNKVLGGWQANVNATISSGLPFTVGYRDRFLDGDTGPNRADLIGDPNPGQGNGVDEPYFNTTPIGSQGSAFGRPAIATFGDQDRNGISGPGFWNVDASLFKRFSFTDRVALELRFEVVNVFNHVNLGNPDSEIGVPGNNNPNAGIISSTAFFGRVPQRNLQFGARFLF